VLQGCGRSRKICPPTLHCILICMKVALCVYPPGLMCSSPFNLCCSHTLPFSATSNLHSHFILLISRFPSSRSSRSPPLLANCEARLPSLVVTLSSCCHHPPVCSMLEYSISSGASSQSANQQCNGTRLPSSACWDFSTAFPPLYWRQSNIAICCGCRLNSAIDFELL